VYDSRVELRLVTRIFMTRHIATRRWVVDSSDAALEVTAGAKAAVPGVPVPAVSAAGPNGTPPPSGTAASAVGAPAGGTAQAGTQWSNETEIGLTGVFQRPVVFGGLAGCRSQRCLDCMRRRYASFLIALMPKRTAVDSRARALRRRVTSTTSGPGPAHTPTWIKPQLTRLVDEAPTGKDWLHEIKYDGYRRV
jgi:hypothetical protein